MTFLDSNGLAPRGFCLAWDPGLLALQIVSDAVIAIACYSIPFALIFLVIKRRDLAFRSMFGLLAIFVMACGTTHLMGILTLWYPAYWADGAAKAVTAVASISIAIILWPLLPKVLAMAPPEELGHANERLAQELVQRDILLEMVRREMAVRQHTEAMLLQSQKMEALGQVTSGVAHDFNNLLTVVQGSLDMLRLHVAGNPRSLALIERALQAAGRGAGLTQQLLAFGRRQPLQPVRLDPVALVHRSLPLLRGTLEGTVLLEVDASPGICEVEADATQIEAALLNLVINARDAMPDHGGVVTIGLANETVGESDGDVLVAGKYVAISVTDTGVGMDMAVAASAFEPFFTTKPIGKGSGLGLSQVYGFARQSRGGVRLRTQPGHGTTVTMLLPCANRAPTSVAADVFDQALGSEAVATRA